MKALISLALKKNIVVNAIKIALIVGTILIAINYGDKIVNGTLTQRDIWKMLLTYLVPYCVSSYSAAKALLNNQTSKLH
jgi:hypothetical protein